MVSSDIRSHTPYYSLDSAFASSTVRPLSGSSAVPGAELLTRSSKLLKTLNSSKEVRNEITNIYKLNTPEHQNFDSSYEITNICKLNTPEPQKLKSFQKFFSSLSIDEGFM
jgi:hypothetical protein